MLIKMIVGISGSRHDNRSWPPPGTDFEVPDWEGRDLIRGGNAVPANSAARRAYETLEWAQEDPEPALPPADPAGTRQLPGTPPATTPAPDPGPAQAPAPDGPGAGASPPARPAAVVPADRPAQPQEPVPASGPVLAPGPAADQDGEDGDESAEKVPEPVLAPGPSAPKQSWIDYAIFRGAAESTAAAMTKADLMSTYGGRL